MISLESFSNQVVDRCTSTNDLAKKLAEAGYPHGTWTSARIQDLGRGRLGRRWESISGNLFLSVIAQVQNQSLWSWIPLVAGLAVARAVRTQFPQLDVRIKWPNDLWIDGAKVGGLLCEGTLRKDRNYIVIGIGLNCVMAPEGIDQKTTSLTQSLAEFAHKSGSARQSLMPEAQMKIQTIQGFVAESQTVLQEGRIISADDIRLLIVKILIEELALLEEQGVSRFLTLYDQYAALPAGTWVEWDNGNRFGMVQKLGMSGELLVTLEDSQEVRIFADDVKLRIATKKSRLGAIQPKNEPRI